MATFGGRRGLGLADAEAMIVKTQRPGGFKGMPDNSNAQGMGSVSDVVLGAVDKVTGGAVGDLNDQLLELRTYLRISIACSILAGGVAVLAWAFPRKRS